MKSEMKSNKTNIPLLAFAFGYLQSEVKNRIDFVLARYIGRLIGSVANVSTMTDRKKSNNCRDLFRVAIPPYWPGRESKMEDIT